MKTDNKLPASIDLRDIPDAVLLKYMARDNKILLRRIEELEDVVSEKDATISEKNKALKELQKTLTQREQAFAAYKKASKAFYDGISKEEGFAELLREIREAKKQYIAEMRTQRDKYAQQLSKYTQILKQYDLI